MSQKNKIKPLFWISGNRRQSQKTFSDIVALIEKNTNSTVNVQMFYCGPNLKNTSQRWTSAGDIIQILRSSDLFDNRPRVIKVCGLSDDYTLLSDWLHKVDDRNVLVFWGPFGYTKPGSKQFISGKTSNLFKQIKAEGKIFEYPTEAKTDSDAVFWIKEIATELKKNIEGSVARRVVELEGRDLDVLTNTVEKLATYQNGKEITLDDVNACCFNDYKDEVWDFLAYLDKQDVDAALGYLKRFYDEGDGNVGETFYGRISRLFGALLQHYQFLMMLKDVCGNTLNVQLAQKALSTFKKTSPSKIDEIRNGTKTIEDLECRFTPYFVEFNIKKDSVQTAFKRRKGEIYAIIDDLYHCMFFCRKSSGIESLLKLCLDSFVLVVCGVISNTDACLIRGKRLRFVV